MPRMSKEQREELEVKKAIELIDTYLGRGDWKVKENSNMGYSVQGLNNYIASEKTKTYWLHKIYDKHIREAHEKGELHLHDLGSLSTYCCGWDLWDLLEQGFGGVPGKIESGPPGHFSSALGQINNFIFTLQGECYSDDTEVLTNVGWKLFKDLDGTEEFFTLNMQSKSIELQSALNFFKYRKKEKLLHFKNSKSDILVTKGHNMLVAQYDPLKNIEDYDLKLIKAEDYNPNTHFVPKGGFWSGEKKDFFELPSIEIEMHNGFTKSRYKKVIPSKSIPMNVWLKFLGMYLSEGGQYSGSGLDKRRNQPRKEYVTRISQKKYYKEFKSVLDELDFNYSESTDKKGVTNFTISNKQLYVYLNSLGDIKNKHVPQEIKDLCVDQLNLFYQYMKLGDGLTNTSNGNELYYTTSKKLADDMQEIYLKLGFNSNIFIKTRDKYSWYIVSKSKTKTSRFKNNSINEVDYDGCVYCVEVPNHTLYVRRNGKAAWCGNCAGAQAFSSFDTLLAPFIRKDKLTYAQIKQFMQEFIFNLNVPTRVGFQSPFSNLSFDVMVSPNYAEMPIIIKGKTDWYLDEHDRIVEKEDGGVRPAMYKEFQKEMDLINKAFCEIMMNGDAKGRIFTFPIPTYNITKDFDWDNPKVKSLFEIASKYGIVYFSNFINSDMKPEDARSMCPMTGDTEVLVKSNHKGIRKEKISTIINTINNNGTQYMVWSGKKWTEAQPVTVDKTKILKITLSNGVELKFGINHLQPTMNNGVLKSKDLKEGMWLPFNKNFVNPSEIGSKDLGYAVGAYVGDGSHDRNSLMYSLCKFDKDDKTESKLVSFWSGLGFECNVTTNEKNVRFVRVNGNPYDIIKTFVSGHNALEKRLTNKCLKMGSFFIEGFIEGYRDTDGSKEKRRIYSVSQELLKDVGTLLSLIGEKYLIHNKDERPNRLGSNPVYRLDNPKRSSYGSYYKEDNQYNYYMIEKIEEFESRSKSLYCFEVDTDDNLFMLASGLITHNCRLRLDSRELRSKGGGLFGAHPLTGSIAVTTLNLPRIGFKNKNDEKGYMKEIDRLLNLARRSMLRKREVLEEKTEKGLYPYVKHYLKKIKKSKKEYWANHFNTIGVLGMHESCLNMFGEGIDSQRGKEFAKRVLIHIREKLSKFQDEDGCLYNLEATPGEGTTYRFARLDKEEFGKEIIISGDHGTYYTNSTHLPVDYDGDIFDVLEHQDDLQTLYTGGCIEKGNHVLTNYGNIKIEEIVEYFDQYKDLKVISYNSKENKSEWDNVIDVHSIDVKKSDKIRIRAERGLDITTSDWHPFFVMEKRKFNGRCPICGIELKSVKHLAAHIRNNKDCAEKYKDYKENNRYIIVEKRADELKVNDYILQNVENLIPDSSNDYTEEIMWLIGYFISDGSMSMLYDNRGGNNLEKPQIRFFDENINSLKKCANIINNNFNSNIKITNPDNRGKAMMVCSTKKNVIDFFKSLGFQCGTKTYNVRIGNILRQKINKSNIYGLISGLIDGDGHIDSRQNDFEYYSVSKNLIEDLVGIFSQAGILCGYKTHPSKRSNEVDIYRLRIPYYEILKIKDKLKFERNNERTKKSLGCKKKRHLPVVRVKSASKIDVEDNLFYDLTVEKNHNYLCGNNTMVFIHNTVSHLFLGQRIHNTDVCKKLVKRIAEKFKLPYFTLSPVFSICPEHGYIPGEHFSCPHDHAEPQ